MGPETQRNTVFSPLHPVCAVAYFAAVIVICMFAFQPVFVGIAAVSGLAFNAYLRGLSSTLATCAWEVPLVLLVALVNPLFSGSGSTLWWSWNGLALYAEGFWYGLCMGGLLIATLLWFSNMAQVVGFDAMTAALGGVAPTVALMLSMIARLVPRSVRRGKLIKAVQDCVERSGHPTTSKRAVAAIDFEGAVPPSVSGQAVASQPSGENLSQGSNDVSKGPIRQKNAPFCMEFGKVKGLTSRDDVEQRSATVKPQVGKNGNGETKGNVPQNSGFRAKNGDFLTNGCESGDSIASGAPQGHFVGNSVASGAPRGHFVGDSIASGARVAGVLMGWCLEDSLEQADTMRARGWRRGVRRTRYDARALRRRDAVVLLAVAICGIAAAFLAATATAQYSFYPVMSQLAVWWGYAPFAVLCFGGLAGCLVDDARWAVSSRRIDARAAAAFSTSAPSGFVFRKGRADDVDEPRSGMTSGGSAKRPSGSAEGRGFAWTR